MTGLTASVRLVYAHTTTRSGKLHHCSQRDSGALIPLCGAQSIRGRLIATYDARPADVALCGDCANLGLTSKESDRNLTGADIPVNEVATSSTRTADQALIDSVAASGVLVPIIVRPAGPNSFLLVAGARRLDAARRTNAPTIPAIQLESNSDAATLVALMENLHRLDLNPIEQAHVYTHALSQFACSKAELGRRIGVSRAQVSNTIRLLQLPAEQQARIAAGELTAQGGRALLATKPTRPPAPDIEDVAVLIGDLLGVRTRVTGRRIALELDDEDLGRLLHALRSEVAA